MVGLGKDSERVSDVLAPTTTNAELMDILLYCQEFPGAQV
jgi:hypothetical protein